MDCQLGADLQALDPVAGNNLPHCQWAAAVVTVDSHTHTRGCYRMFQIELDTVDRCQAHAGVRERHTACDSGLH